MCIWELGSSDGRTDQIKVPLKRSPTIGRQTLRTDVRHGTWEHWLKEFDKNIKAHRTRVGSLGKAQLLKVWGHWLVRSIPWCLDV